MTYPVILVPEMDGQFTAILRNHGLSATAPTREEALARLRHRADRILSGRVEHASIDLTHPEPGGLLAVAGIFADDPDLPRIVADAYRARDAEPYGSL